MAPAGELTTSRCYTTSDPLPSPSANGSTRRTARVATDPALAVTAALTAARKSIGETVKDRGHEVETLSCEDEHAFVRAEGQGR